MLLTRKGIVDAVPGNPNRHAWGANWLRFAILLALGGQLLPARHLPIQVYTSAQGLPRNSVECLLPSPAGLMWMCTLEGLVRFDGYHFRVFGPEQGLPSRNVLDFVAARDGGFWLLTERGLCRLPPGSKIGEPCKLLQADNKGAPFYAGLIFLSEKGDTWVSGSDSLFRVSGDGRRLEQSSLRLPPRLTITALADGWNGTLLISTDMALFEWRPGEEARNLTQSMGAVGILCFYRWSADEYWLGSTDGFYRLWHTASGTAIRREPLGGMTA